MPAFTAKTIWIFGLPSSGKTLLANKICDYYRQIGQPIVHLDGDILRGGLCEDLGFDIESRTENLRRSVEVSQLIRQSGVSCVCSFITPLIQQRLLIQDKVIASSLIMMYLDVPVEQCIARDAKGLYAKALAGEISNFTGVDSPFEPPSVEEKVVVLKNWDGKFEACWKTTEMLLKEVDL